MRNSLRLLGLAAAFGVLAACTPDQAGAPAKGTSLAPTCSDLQDARRDAVRRLDAVEQGREQPHSSGALFMLGGLLNLNLAAAATMHQGDVQARQQALAELRSARGALDREINDRRCTVEARGIDGTAKPVEGGTYDGVYSGKGSAQSWCTSLRANLKVVDGKVSGTVDDARGSFEVKGQLYQGGDVALRFKPPRAGDFTDDFDGRLDDRGSSFAAKLDVSPQACSYSFVLPHSVPPTVVAWATRPVLIEGKSPPTCPKGNTTYRFELARDTLTIKSRSSEFSTPVSADGTVRISFRLPPNYQLEVAGNVRTRDLEITNLWSKCHWQLQPTGT